MARAAAAVRGRPMLVAIAGLNAVTGLFAAFVLVPLSFGGDVDIYRRGAQGISAGVIARDFLYSPLFGLLATPLTWVPLTVAALAMAGIGIAILLAGTALETRGLAAVDRILVTIAALGFIPVVYELVIGQVTMLIAASILPVRDRDGIALGIPLGIVLALIPKPFLVPLLVWMLVRRRSALAGALGTAAIVTFAGIAVLGTDLYIAWGRALVGTGQIDRPGNLALTALGARGFVWPLVTLASAVILWAIARDERRGFVAAILGALLVQPFTLTYAISVVLVAVRPAVSLAPVTTRMLAISANIGILVAFMAWAATGLVSYLPIPARYRPEGPRVPVTERTAGP